ncbi:MAG: class IV adenylate cyclase [Blastocatellia bacterium]
MSHEIEVKVKLGIAAFAPAGIALALHTARHFEDNWLLDTAQHQLGKQASVLRIRIVEGKGLLTYKGKADDAPASQFKLRVELETELGDPHEALAIFEQLGYHRFFRYQKYRSVYEAKLPSGQQLEVMADETPIGDFLELEGAEDAIAEAVRLLAVTPDDYILDSYLGLQFKHCHAQGRALEDMVF